MSDRHNARSYFARRNALVDRGWLAVLTGLQLAVWTCYDRKANADGLAWPDDDKVAKAVGNANPKRMREARAMLIKNGLLEVAETGARGAILVFRVLVPPMLPSFVPESFESFAPRPGESDAAPTPELGVGGPSRPTPNSGVGGPARPTPNLARDLPPIWPGTYPQFGGRLYKEEGILEGIQEGIHAARGATGRVDRGDGEDPRQSRPDDASSPHRPSPHASVVKHFTEAWSARYGGKRYPFGKRDGRLVKELIAACETADDAIAAVDRYLADTDRFFFGHPLSKLVGQVTRFMSDPPPAGKGLKNGNGHNGHGTNRIPEGLRNPR